MECLLEVPNVSLVSNRGSGGRIDVQVVLGTCCEPIILTGVLSDYDRDPRKSCVVRAKQNSNAVTLSKPLNFLKALPRLTYSYWRRLRLCVSLALQNKSTCNHPSRQPCTQSLFFCSWDVKNGDPGNEVAVSIASFMTPSGMK